MGELKDQRLEAIANALHVGTSGGWKNPLILKIGWSAEDYQSYEMGVWDTVSLVRKALEAYDNGADITELQEIILETEWERRHRREAERAAGNAKTKAKNKKNK